MYLKGTSTGPLKHIRKHCSFDLRFYERKKKKQRLVIIKSRLIEMREMFKKCWHFYIFVWNYESKEE